MKIIGEHVIKQSLQALNILIFSCAVGIMPNSYGVAPNTVIGTVSDPGHTFNGPFDIAITADGIKSYVTNNSGNSVSIVNVATNAVTGMVSDGSGSFDFPGFITITPDGTKAYVANQIGGSGGSGSVSIINVATNTVTGDSTRS
jgi:YVTN family beta-propeller protein